MAMINSQDRILMLLANGFSQEFVDFILNSDEYSEIIMQLADEFVEEYIPLNDDDLKTDMAFELIKKTSLIAI